MEGDFASALAWFNGLSQRKAECEQGGHRSPHFSDSVNQMMRGGGTHELHGFCGYCLGEITRGASPEEQRAYIHFDKLLHEPMTL